MNVGIIVCANGLGHIRRVLAILNYILHTRSDELSNYRFTIYFPIKRLNYLKTWDDFKFINRHSNVIFNDYSYPINFDIDSLRDKLWEEMDIECFKEYDIIWTDNITQLLELNTKVMMTGSFFWYEILDSLSTSGNVKNFVKGQRKLVKSKNPVMIGNEYFATHDVQNLTQFRPVGFYRYNITNHGYSDKQDILLSAGLGGESVKDCQFAIEKIIDNDLKPPRVIWLEPKIYKNSFPDWIKPAQYSSEMFSKCYAACIRPGIGTISDSVLGGSYIISFCDSPEMYHNSSVLTKNGFGEIVETPFKAYMRAKEIFNNKKILDLAKIKTAHLRSDGVSGSAEIIWKLINNTK